MSYLAKTGIFGSNGSGIPMQTVLASNRHGKKAFQGGNEVVKQAGGRIPNVAHPPPIDCRT